MFEDLEIIVYPDPRLKKVSKPIECFGQELRDLTARMFELMREDHGVGLAAPQIGQNIRLFVINPTGEPQDDRVYVNPVLTDAEGEQEDEEGCLSLPDIRVPIVRSRDLRMQAKDLDGRPFEERASGYIARIWQHEFDHLNGILLIDRMGPVAKLANRKIIKDLEQQYAADHRPVKR